MPSILVVQPDTVSAPGLIRESLQRTGIEQHVAVLDTGGSLPENPMAFDGVVVLGGLRSVPDADQRECVATVGEIIRNFHSTDRPVLGIGLGAQLIAATFDAKVRRADELQFGLVPLRKCPAAADDPLLQEAAQDQRALVWHEDCFEQPDGALHLLTRDGMQNYGFRLEANTYGLQCHLEVTDRGMGRMVERGRHLVVKHLGDRGAALLAGLTDQARQRLGSANRFGTMVTDAWVQRVNETAAAR